MRAELVRFMRSRKTDTLGVYDRESVGLSSAPARGLAARLRRAMAFLEKIANVRDSATGLASEKKVPSTAIRIPTDLVRPVVQG